MKRILVIEDEESVRESLLDLLMAEDFETQGAENGVIGINLALKEIPDLIICDIMMPEVDGYEVLNTLRKNPLTATTPFIFLSAKADKADFRQGMQLGADDYLTKPFTRADLLEAIETRLAKQAAVTDKFQKKVENLRNSLAYSLPQDLNTPLTVILMSSYLLQKGGAEPQQIAEIAGKINTAAETLQRLIKKFLFFAELEIITTDPGKIKELGNFHTNSPAELITEIASSRALELERENDLEIDLEDTALPISTSNLGKLVEELVDNAFRYSPPETPVKISSRITGLKYSLAFSNVGRGMTQEEILNAGTTIQFDRKLKEKNKSGLGLTIVKRLIDLHNGTLEFKSTPGETTTITVTLPAC